MQAHTITATLTFHSSREVCAYCCHDSTWWLPVQRAFGGASYNFCRVHADAQGLPARDRGGERLEGQKEQKCGNICVLIPTSDGQVWVVYKKGRLEKYSAYGKLLMRKVPGPPLAWLCLTDTPLKAGHALCRLHRCQASSVCCSRRFAGVRYSVLLRSDQAHTRIASQMISSLQHRTVNNDNFAFAMTTVQWTK